MLSDFLKRLEYYIFYKTKVDVQQFLNQHSSNSERTASWTKEEYISRRKMRVKYFGMSKLIADDLVHYEFKCRELEVSELGKRATRNQTLFCSYGKGRLEAWVDDDKKDGLHTQVCETEIGDGISWANRCSASRLVLSIENSIHRNKLHADVRTR